MHRAYHVLLFVACFAILVDCQGGGGGGGGGGGDSSGGGGSDSGSSSTCTTKACRGIGGALSGLMVLGMGICCYWNHRRGRPTQKNSNFVGVTKSEQLKQEVNDVNIFQSGIWSSRYFQYSTWHGPYEFSLSFDPPSTKVAGSGSDDIGTFTIDGTYSPKTLRIGLTKKYQRGTGDSSENLGHALTIQLIWNAQNNQFEGKWYVQTRKFRGEDKFELKFEREDAPPASEIV